MRKQRCSCELLVVFSGNWPSENSGIGEKGQQTPVLCVESLAKTGRHRRERIRVDLLQLGHNNPATRGIENVLFHKSFPVDIRHNSKIFREQLTSWAEKKVR